MTAVLLAVAAARAEALAEELELAGIDVLDRIPPEHATGLAVRADELRGADALVIPAERACLSGALREACDRAGVRILALGDGPAAARLTRRHGIGDPLPASASGWDIADALRPRGAPVVPSPDPAAGAAAPAGRLITVWGPHGSPGRSTVAVQLAALLAGADRAVALVDADTHAPAVALLLGLTDDGPGIAAACRRAELGLLDGAELSRLATPVETSGGTLDVLVGINRPARWPELSPARLRGALDACRHGNTLTLVDVSASLEADEEIVSDLDGLRRNAATLTAVHSADRIVAVAAADPLGIARFVRGYADLRAEIGDAPVTVAVNKVRPGPLGVDARGQIRRALDRFSAIRDVHFLPYDQRALDAAALHARPVADVSGRSPFTTAVRALAASLLRDEQAPVTTRRARRREAAVG
ncbi:MinD-like ATPase involved in chromosome partitioning or flagellar assembly [Microbacterium azadirachtae]|uniref:MinD-like ATPase involved in chromosome partitioning or flagellar assembly n=1 Tax=Microbacterium azadirachtae TaxID=582680 RepID=A0A1I6GHZ0_9MICO|nr:P-loop NTPase [Microbacterium azadirachtae]SFR41812.1 MinD-like ATPase involved in chromosome partitioning or flagellar assembly [Microbacterium azadirachtae]